MSPGTDNSGFTLVELILVIVVIGILVAVAVQNGGQFFETARTEETKQEMDQLAAAIVGNPELHNNGIRADFGYVGDVGALPPNLDALIINPGGYSTWNGPYLTNDFVQDASDFKTDPWGAAYSLGSASISSTGSGSTIVRKLASTAPDLLYNSVGGNIYDADGTPPGTAYLDSLAVQLVHPNGAGGLTTRTSPVGPGGNFSFDSVPVGNHTMEIRYVPGGDTLHHFVSVVPGSILYSQFRLSSNYWIGGGGNEGPTAGLVGHWKLDETSGTTAFDAVGNNDGTLTNMSGFQWTAGKIGGALEFDGANDEVIIPDADTLDNTQQLTLSVWVYAHTLDNKPRGPLSKRITHNSQYSYSMFFYHSDRLNVDIQTNNNRFACPQTFYEDQWYHLAVVFDGTLPGASRTKVYSNGALIHTAFESSTAISNFNSPLVIGQLNGNNSGYFDGLIDDVRVYNRALTPSEIQELYDMGS